MLKWLTGKLRANRVARWNSQLVSEFALLAPEDVALVLINAMEFALSFRQAENGFIISKAIEEPSKHLNPDGAQELYGRLEDILVQAQIERGPMLARARESLPPVQHAAFSRSVELNHVSLRLLMFRVACVFGGADAALASQIRETVRGALHYIDQAATQVEKSERAFATSGMPQDYKFLRDMAYNYGAAFGYS